MKARLGMYFYQPLHNCWGIWRYTAVSENGSSAEKITEFCYREDAVKYVYEMNGWTKKKVA